MDTSEQGIITKLPVLAGTSAASPLVKNGYTIKYILTSLITNSRRWFVDSSWNVRYTIVPSPTQL